VRPKTSARKPGRPLGLRGASRFRAAEMSRAIKAAAAAGHDLASITVRLNTGDFVLTFAANAAPKLEQQSAS
jgi:hypothetical protein